MNTPKEDLQEAIIYNLEAENTEQKQLIKELAEGLEDLKGMSRLPLPEHVKQHYEELLTKAKAHV